MTLSFNAAFQFQHFSPHSTGKERDVESGNDYMFARYYNSATGRFLSPDWDAKSSDPVPYAKLDDPQSLNLYSYVRNNPIGRADPDGHDGCGSSNDGVCDAVSGRGSTMSGTEMKAWGGLLLGAATAGVASGWEATVALARVAFGYAAANAPQIIQTVNETVQAAADPAAGSLTTFGSASRLSQAEVSTGERLASQQGLKLTESKHIGEEFVDQAGKTYDAMGGPAAYAKGKMSDILESIDHHLNKSADFVALDLKGLRRTKQAPSSNTSAVSPRHRKIK